ncbi:copper amine oxidase [Helicostylum pulchrum]|uniref:Amine oxidase n=1 Tax=Helicostylum pulchrum TaxID=562976 RepID=A0ABP9YFW0_9FUNG|nr:copper amine oxidase [Helicostylum pulchrum]
MTVSLINDHPIHPFDQLTGDEIIRVASIVRKHNTFSNYIFNTITLKEPNKKHMLSFLGWDDSEPHVASVEREAFVIVLEKETENFFEGIVSLTSGLVKSWKYVPDVQAGFTLEEMLAVNNLVATDEKVRLECLELGIMDMSQVFSDPWSVARHNDYPGRDRRIMNALLYTRTSEEDNQYAHPLDFVVVVDVNKLEILTIERTQPRSSKFTRATIPQQNHNFLPKFMNEQDYRQDIKPIIIQQPEGVSFTVKGNEINWQKWNMHISMNHREGIVIRNVNYQDGNERRPLFYRIAISEMVVPYADPSSPYNRKQAFDVGEYGFGRCANSLNLGCDCVGSIYYFDADFNDHEGKTYRVDNAICLHEEDYGILMKHTDYRNNLSYSVRSRRLVISQIVTAANYDYGVYYYFYQDGTFEYEVKATGILSTSVLAEDETPGGFGTMVAPQVNAQYHQHFFTMRIDPMIDGLNNSVLQVDVRSLDSPTGSINNTNGNGFTAEHTTLKDTLQGQANSNYDTSRFWKIVNKEKIHPYALVPVGWKISSSHLAPLYARHDSLVAERAGFLKKTLWVTPYDENQMFAGGNYCNQSSGKDTLEVWANSKVQDIEQKDIVVWYTFGITHLPRAEDFPIMPVEYCGFIMKPCNFFLRNPAIDIKPTNASINQSVLANAEKNETCCSK